jgi:hypothetical protein
MNKINNLILEMINFDAGEPKLIQHFIKVYEFGKLIGSMENVSDEIMEIIQVVTIVHDIGIKVSIEKYGECNGKLQEQEGPVFATKLLDKLRFDQKLIERVCYLVAHHHTYSNIDGIDYQILVEADFLVNIYENKYNEMQIENIYNKIFITESGRKILRQMFM